MTLAGFQQQAVSGAPVTPSDFTSVSDAIARAQRAGLTAELWCGVQVRGDHFRVTLTTSDPDPTLSIGDEYAHPERASLLATRDQSGPETWDYLASRSRVEGRFFLRISGTGRSADIPVVDALAAIVREHGWTENERALAPALVARERLTAAIVYCLTGAQGAQQDVNQK